MHMLAPIAPGEVPVTYSKTDMVKSFDGAGALIEQWLKNKDTVLFLGAWKRINNPDFNPIEFEGIRNNTGRNSFFLSGITLELQ